MRGDASGPSPDGAATACYGLCNAPNMDLPPGGGDAVRAIVNAPFLNPGPGRGYAMGAESPTLTVIEFGDLECMACRAFGFIMREFVSRHPSEVRWIFRHYPLDPSCNASIHSPKHLYACATARAAEAAGSQGKFWEFENAVNRRLDDTGAPIARPDLSNEALRSRAERLGLDMKEWNADARSEEILSKITEDIRVGDDADVESTPTIFVNGRMISGSQTLATLEAWLEMARKGELDPRGPAMLCQAEPTRPECPPLRKH